MVSITVSGSTVASTAPLLHTIQPSSPAARATGAVVEIEQMVDAENASLLIIGLRKRSAVGKLILGSVAQELLMNVSCPVLCVKAG